MDGWDRRTVEQAAGRRRAARTDDVKEVIRVMQNSPTAAYLRECSFHERVMVAAVVRCVKRAGVEEVAWGDVSAMLCRFGSFWRFWDADGL
jgi:origin recognition complex subunit 1